MMTHVSNISGEVILMPETIKDKLLLYHLMNCYDLTKFTEYLAALAEKPDMSIELGFDYKEFEHYMDECYNDTIGDSTTGLILPRGQSEH